MTAETVDSLFCHARVIREVDFGDHINVGRIAPSELP